MDASLPPLIEFRAVTKIYGSGEAEVRALDGADFAIARGEFVAIMGPSGSGKSTAMNILGCLDVPTSGDYLFQGRELLPHRRAARWDRVVPRSAARPPATLQDPRALFSVVVDPAVLG